ncbi:MAG: sigma-70 family RNA polymerase sigma factor [Dongiaceae bacterium]
MRDGGQRGGGEDRALRRYVDRIMAEPLLSAEREQALARRWREAGDETALGELVRPYLRLAATVARQARRYGETDELLQEASLGLMEAARRFDPERNVRFGTFAVYWMRACVQHYLVRSWSMVRLSSTNAGRTLFFNLRRLQRREEAADPGAGRDVVNARVAAALGLPVEEIERADQRLSGFDTSLDQPVGDEDGAALGDLIADPGQSPEEVVVGTRDAAARSRWLREALTQLPPREQRILERRWLADAGNEARPSLEMLGHELGITKERVRQLETRALKRIRACLQAREQVAPAASLRA